MNTHADPNPAGSSILDQVYSDDMKQLLKGFGAKIDGRDQIHKGGRSLDLLWLSSDSGM